MGSSSALTTLSWILNPILPVGRLSYWSNIRVSAAILTKVPLIKYTPLSIEKVDPAVTQFSVNVDAKDSPAGTKTLFSGPETMFSSHAKSSPSLNSDWALSPTPDERYEI